MSCDEGRVTTGMPMKRASRVVEKPPKGNVSSTTDKIGRKKRMARKRGLKGQEKERKKRKRKTYHQQGAGSA